MTDSWPVAYLVASPECRVVPELAYQAAFDEALGRIRELGYDGVEIQVRDPGDPLCSNLGQRCEDAGVRVAALGTGPIGAQDQLTLTSLDEGARAAALLRVEGIVELAAELQVPVTLGGAKGTLVPGHDDEQRGWLVTAIERLAERAVAGGQQLLVEPQCVGNLIRSTADVVELFGDPDTWSAGMGIVLDSWHAQQAGEDWAEAWQRCGFRIGYVQLAGPLRGPLAEGDELSSLLQVAIAHGYAGWLGAEHRQVPASDAAASASWEALRKTLPSTVTGPVR
jgi:sugar phosphate isomerase/epimerase